MKRFSFAITVVLLNTSLSFSAPLSFTVLQSHLTLTPGSSPAVVTGTISNSTGSDLTETDLFFNAYGFDPAAVSFSQVLGTTTDNPVPNNQTTGPLPLFTVDLMASASSTVSYPLTVTLEDINGDISSPLTLTVAASAGGTAVPESSTFLLTISGVIMCFAVRQRRYLKRSLQLLLVLSYVSGTIFAQSGSGLATFSAGVALNRTGQAVVDFTIVNNGVFPIVNLQVQSVLVPGLVLASPSSFPVAVGDLPPGNTASVTITLDNAGGAVGRRFLVTLRGTYQSNGALQGFTLNRFITIPPPGTVNGASVTVFSNPTDELLAEIRDASGNTIDYFGPRDANGLPIDLTSFSVTTPTGSRTTFILDAQGRIALIEEPNNVEFQVRWTSSTTANVTLFVSGSPVKTATIDFSSLVTAAVPLSQPRRTSAAAEYAPRILSSVNPLQSSTPIYNAFAHVTECNGARSTDASVFFQYATAIALPSLPGIEIAPGVYASSIPGPNTAAAASAQQTCNSIGSAVSQVCSVVKYATLIAAPFAPFFPAYTAPLALAGLACTLVKGGAVVPPGAPNIIQGFCTYIPAINRGLNTPTSVMAIASVPGGGTLNGGPAQTTLPANFSFDFPGVNCTAPTSLTLTHTGNTPDVAFSVSIKQGSTTLQTFNLDLGPHTSSTLSLSQLNLAPGTYTVSITLRFQGTFTNASYTLQGSPDLTFSPSVTNNTVSGSLFFNVFTGAHNIDTYTLVKR